MFEFWKKKGNISTSTGSYDILIKELYSFKNTAMMTVVAYTSSNNSEESLKILKKLYAKMVNLISATNITNAEEIAITAEIKRLLSIVIDLKVNSENKKMALRLVQVNWNEIEKKIKQLLVKTEED
jgi:hypothetical protein